MNSQLRDEELIQMQLTTHRNDYFETLYKRYVAKVYQRCLQLIKDSAKAEDYTHDIFLRVYGNLNNFNGKSAFSTWLYSISYNYCIDQIRCANRNPIVSLETGQDYSSTDSTDQENRECQFQQLDKAMESISNDEALMLRMKYEDGLDIKEIAEHMHLKISAVKMRLKRSRDKVRQVYCDPF
ncbi:RNA polymerase sigma factor [Spirosoma agri]|uniref:RNA polymerase sigma factor n=1 Tax=Spirosoma agri TaxID=1987381 RepID=A0A6M0IHN2_9BACT|nr:RNA polymerase sigma factor [Spirosoma agri]NEU67728.1 RNA polymerase sigma factor [Spirosoma agri]